VSIIAAAVRENEDRVPGKPACAPIGLQESGSYLSEKVTIFIFHGRNGAKRVVRDFHI
jgi:hypothetical protein